MTNHGTAKLGARTLQWGYTRNFSDWGVETVPNANARRFKTGWQLNLGRVYVRWTR